jgi:predicted PhzF superfamily epimerase YddE/YHI9
VDAFAERAFTGNPAAVFLLGKAAEGVDAVRRGRDEPPMTAFVSRRQEPDGEDRAAVLPHSISVGYERRRS